MVVQPKKTKQTARVVEYFLDRTEREIHGFELVEKDILKSGSLYPMLIRLEKLGWLDSRWEETNRPGPRRRMYRLTGRGELAAQRFLAEANESRGDTARGLARPGGEIIA